MADLQNIPAIFEDGVLKPLEPLHLAEHQHVRVSVSADAPLDSSTSHSESFFDAASRLGYIGCIKDTTRDLSTNKAYMEGFGKKGA